MTVTIPIQDLDRQPCRNVKLNSNVLHGRPILHHGHPESQKRKCPHRRLQRLLQLRPLLPRRRRRRRPLRPADRRARRPRRRAQKGPPLPHPRCRPSLTHQQPYAWTIITGALWELLSSRPRWRPARARSRTSATRPRTRCSSSSRRCGSTPSATPPPRGSRTSCCRAGGGSCCRRAGWPRRSSRSTRPRSSRRALARAAMAGPGKRTRRWRGPG